MTKSRLYTYIIHILMLLLVSAVITVIVKIPTWFIEQGDAMILGNITTEEKAVNVWGFEYSLTTNEKLYILSNALNNRTLPQSDYYARTRWLESISNPQIQSYAFQQVTNEADYNEEKRKQAFSTLKTELDILSEKNILPELDFGADLEDYEAVLFSAIDILEPQKHVVVWQISYSGITFTGDLVDCIMDAKTNKIYSVSIRTEKTWADYNTDEIVRLWAEYIGLSTPEPYISDSPLMEDATNYQKYFVNDQDGNKTIITMGYYEGVYEFFIKIAR